MMSKMTLSSMYAVKILHWWITLSSKYGWAIHRPRFIFFDICACLRYIEENIVYNGIMGFIDKIYTSYKFDPSICKDGLELACFQQTNVSKLPVNSAAACFQARAADLTAWTSCSWSLSWRRGGWRSVRGGRTGKR